MNESILRSALRVTGLCLAVAAALLAGCQKRSTTEETHQGSVTTTTIEPTPAVRQELGQAASATAAMVDRAASATSRALDKARDAAGDAADKVRESASSGTLARVGDAAASAASRVGDAASGAVDRIQESASSGALARAGDAASGAIGRAGDALADAAITAKVKVALLADERVKGLQIDVDTRAGSVALTERGHAGANLEVAAEIARRIDGVKSVESRSPGK